MRAIVRFVIAVFVLFSPIRAQGPEPGISRALARARAARLSEVRYDLHFELRKGMEEVAGEARVTFDLPEERPPQQDLVLDFAGDLTRDVHVNGFPRGEGAVRRVHDHLVVSAETLVPGRNAIDAWFTSPVAATGTPLTTYREAEQEFVYTLLVPADAHVLFPCFDQPDLKAVYDLSLTLPDDWVPVANAAPEDAPERTPEGEYRWEFEETLPLSTYLFAFAAGPFDVVAPATGGEPPIRVVVRRSRRDELEVDVVTRRHVEALQWLETKLSTPFPFGKLDVVLLPGFPYGGMEHAGAIFYRESALVFDHPPTESELTRRSTLIYHEVTHQWFGNLVTMTWFDDLWLKEGFATFVAYWLLDELQPERRAWLRFHQRVKPRALRVDVTPGTTPIYQDLENLADAKSAYGAIVYNKAPAVLRELQQRLGAEAFLRGVQTFLRRHAFGNAQWSDLVAALESAARAELRRWSERWILAAGMPRVRVRWSADDEGRIREFELLQEAVGGSGTWPLRVELLLVDADGSERRLAAVSDDAVTPVPELIGTEAPAAVLPNPDDVAYGLFLLDTRSRGHLLDELPADPVARAVALTALFDAVRETELDPAVWVPLALEQLRGEGDPESHAWLLGTLGTTLRRYLSEDDAAELADAATELLLQQVVPDRPGVALQAFRFLARSGPDPRVLDLCRRLLAQDGEAPLQLGTEDRYLALAALLAAGTGDDRAAVMTGPNTPPDAERHAFAALAARPEAEVKDRYFETYLRPGGPPEQWVQESLAYFHWPGQNALTLPFLDDALEAVEWVKEHRKIFFMPAWVDAFVNAHSSREALTVVESFLAEREDLAIDIERKILQSLDGLRRAVAIKERWQ